VTRRLPPAVVAALAALLTAAGGALAQSPAPAVNYSSMKWHDLTPGGWDVQKVYRKFDLASMWNLDDRDPRAKAVLRRLSAALDQAPADPELDGRPVKIHGFVVPLKGTPEAITEFLLVPWQNGCVHTPPPAANQRVRVIAKTPLRHADPNQAIYVWGRLAARASATSAGKAAYTLTFDRMEPYDWQTARRADW
jgi:hypothetical protein